VTLSSVDLFGEYSDIPGCQTDPTAALEPLCGATGDDSLLMTQIGRERPLGRAQSIAWGREVWVSA
jgi:hypothetical protein